MSDYIKRENALRVIADNNFSDEITLGRYDKIIDGIYDIPSADVAPVRHGRWVKDNVFGIPVYRCSVCDKEFWLSADDTPQGSSYRYCPNCSAKMDEEETK